MPTRPCPSRGALPEPRLPSGMYGVGLRGLGVPNGGAARAGLSGALRTHTKRTRPRERLEGGGMPVGAEGVHPGRGCHMERARERLKAPSPVDRLAQGVELILQNEVKPRCGHFASRLSALTFLLSPSLSLAG